VPLPGQILPWLAGWHTKARPQLAECVAPITTYRVATVQSNGVGNGTGNTTKVGPADHLLGMLRQTPVCVGSGSDIRTHHSKSREEFWASLPWMYVPNGETRPGSPGRPAHQAPLPGASGEFRRVALGTRPGSRKTGFGGTYRTEVRAELQHSRSSN